jgi:predicted nicotinamide N-methyase
MSGRRESPYDGPVIETPVAVAGRTVRVVRPADPDRLLDDPAILDWNRRDDYMPYWAYLWPGAYLLAEAVGRGPWSGEVLEIGCGLGLAGLVALAGGARVHFTDYDETPLRFVARSAAANGFDEGAFRTSLLDWRDLPDERYATILGADVLYERRLVPLVAGVIARMLAEGGVALVAGPYRVATEGLDAELDRHGLAARSEPVAATTEMGRAVRGTLHRISRSG